MRWTGVVLLTASMVPAIVGAQAKKKPTTPAVFDQARYVWVEAQDGDAYTPGLLPEDRQAIADVENMVRDWKRYALTASRRGADLVFVVRKGRLATARFGGSVGTGGPGNSPASQPIPGQQRPSVGLGTGVGVGAEAGPPDDLLEVYMAGNDGMLGIRVWQRSQSGGLDAPEVALIRNLRRAVEKDYPHDASAPPPAKP